MITGTLCVACDAPCEQLEVAREPTDIERAKFPAVAAAACVKVAAARCTACGTSGLAMDELPPGVRKSAADICALSAREGCSLGEAHGAIFGAEYSGDGRRALLLAVRARVYAWARLQDVADSEERRRRSATEAQRLIEGGQVLFPLPNAVSSEIASLDEALTMEES